MTPVRLEPAALRSRVKHSTTEPPRSHIRLLYGSKYGLILPSTIKHDFYSITGHLKGLHTVLQTFVRVTLELLHIRVCFDIKLTRFDGLASEIFERIKMADDHV